MANYASVQSEKFSSKGRKIDAKVLEEMRVLLAGLPLRRDYLIEALHRVQDAHLGLSVAELAAISRLFNLPQAAVYEVASFYHHFNIIRDKEHHTPVLVRICESISCNIAGGEKLMAELQDAGVVFERVSCVGQCDRAPAAVVKNNVIPKAEAFHVIKAVQALKNSKGAAVPLPLHAIGYENYRKTGGYKIAHELIMGKRGAEEILSVVETSGLRGLGGAGFPTARKWKSVRAEKSPRILVVNADEGEPGTFKDRHYLERDPHRFLEGALIAAYCVGAGEIFIYLRDEYAQCRALLTKELAKLKTNPPFPLPPIELRRGAGAYICGEESGLIESIEGKRGMPRLRPPYVAQVGLFGRPTLEHNLETLYWLRDIVEKGGQWYANHGRRGRSGLRSFSVSGRVKNPGVYMAPAGISLHELIEEYAGGMALGHELYAYLPGGASGGILPAELADVPLDFDTLQPYGCFIGSAAIVVLSKSDLARDAAKNLMNFFAHESCGQCTPCRVGTQKAAGLLQAKKWDEPLLKDLCQVMEDASICGLGQAAPNPVRSVLKYFRQEVN